MDAMNAEDSASASPTPEALVSRLGKLKRTLTNKLSEQRRASSDKGYIAAANTRGQVTDAPNLLRPSPGLDFLFSDKIERPVEVPVGRPASSPQAQELESSAPPVDLDRDQGSSGPSAQPLSMQQPSPVAHGGVQQAEATSAAINHSIASPLKAVQLVINAASAAAELPQSLDASTAAEPAQAEGTSDAPRGGSAQLKPATEAEAAALHMFPQMLEVSGTRGAVPTADPDTPLDAQTAANAESVSNAAATVGNSNNMDPSEGAGNPEQNQKVDKSAVQSFSVLQAQGSASAEDSLKGSQKKAERDVEVSRKEAKKEAVGSQGEAEIAARGSQREARDELLPVTEEGLDSAMQELALEVSQLQPVGRTSTGEEGPMRQGSYLQRHTSSLILKMSQDAAVPPLPAVANLASAKSEVSSQTGSPRTPAKPADTRKTIKTMAASLFRAFDEGKLRERGRALVQQQGVVDTAEQPLEASIRTYKSSPTRREKARSAMPRPPVSPARTSSYSLQKASLHRSLSPITGRQAPLLTQPEWDGSKPAKPSLKAEHGADAVHQAAASGVTSLHSLPSPQKAKHATVVQNRSLQPCDPASGTVSAAAEDNSTAESSSAGRSTLHSCGLQSRSQPQGQSSPTPSPPRFRRLPSSSLADRPGWASTSSSRNPPAPSVLSPLRRSTGSRHVSAAPAGSNHRHHATEQRDRTGSGEGSAPVPHPAPVEGRAVVSQGSIGSHADYMADVQAHSQAQAMQRLQQAVEEYNSSSPHVLVPAAVELAAALRQAAKRPGHPRPSVEALQLAGLKLKHEGGDSASPNQTAPASPWPEWVKGAWGSPQAAAEGPRASAAAVVPSKGRAVSAVDSVRSPKPQDREGSPQHAQRGPRISESGPHGNGWTPVKQSQPSARGRQNTLVRQALAEAEAAAAQSSANQPRQIRKPTQARASASPTRAVSANPRSSATPPRVSAKPSRVSRTPPRSAATPPRGYQHAVSASQPAHGQTASSQASKPVKRPSLRGSPAGGSSKHTWQPTSASPHAFQGHPEPAVKGSQPAQKGKTPPSRVASVQSRQRESALQAFGMAPSAQHTNVAWADRERLLPGLMQVAEDTEQPEHPQHSVHAEPAEHAPALLPGASSNPGTSLKQKHHAEHAVVAPAGVPSHEEFHAVDSPVRSMTSVAALRQSFEWMSPPAAASGASLKPRNRLPLRKASSKAHVFDSNGSPQQAALLWQHSLRGERDVEDATANDDAEHAEHKAARQDWDAHSMAEAETMHPALPLHHTMSALVTQRRPSLLPRAAEVASTPVRLVAGHRPGSEAMAGNSPASVQSPLALLGSPRLTQAVLAAAEDVRSSAEKLPVSHRLPVSRSVFDSDEGSLVSSEGRDDDGATGSGLQASATQPLTEEATLALLPDRGMSPVSESLDDHIPSGSGGARHAESARRLVSTAQHAHHTSIPASAARDEVYPWSALGWAFSPSWFRVVCRLCPSPPPHFATPLPPHTLHTSLGLHGADAQTYTFDQILPGSSEQQELVGQALGAVEAVLMGRNSAVLALGQTAAGKTHSLLGDDPNDPEASSSSLVSAPGASSMLVEALFSEMQQQRVASQVQSVYVTAFQIMDETIQDLLQPQQPDADSRQHRRRGATLTGRHEVFVDKQKRTWVSNLAAVQIASSADFQQTLDLVSSCRHRSGPSPGLSHLSHGPSTCIVTLLVTADIPAASLSAPLQSQSQSPDQALRGASQTQRRRVCSKLTFVEVGSSTVPVQAAPLGTVSAGRSMSKHHQLSRSSTSISTATSSAPRSSGGDRGGGLSRGGRETAAAARPIKSQDSTMRSVAEVVWAAAHGKGLPVPHQACKLTRYLQDTLCPSGRAVVLVCVNPSTEMQSSSTPVLKAAERMVTV